MTNEVDLIQKNIHCHLSLGDLPSALDELQKWINALLSDGRIMGNVFGSLELDQLCLKIGESALNLKSPSAQSDLSQSQVDIVFVASEFYMTGGHTALVEDYIKALPDKNTRILVTDPDGKLDRNSIINRMSTTTCDVRFSPPDSSAFTKLNWLIDELKIAKAGWTFFVNHPHDLIAVAGMHQSLSKRRAFVHHADHTFTLGLFVDVDKHIDFRKKGWENCRHQLGVTNNDLIALSVPDMECPSAANRFQSDGGLVTCTSGNNKFELPYSFRLEDCVPEWLKTTGGRHIHIGKLSQSTELNIRRQLNDLNIDADRLTILPWVESLWQTLLLCKVDFYIDSFPLCGCRALVEAMGAGVPVAVHKNYRNSLFSNEGFAYDSAFTWSKPEELNAHLQSIDQVWLETQSLNARTHYLNNHTAKNLGQNLDEILNQKTISNSANARNYHLDPLRAFFDGFDGQPLFLQSCKTQRMIQLVALAKAVDLPVELFEHTLESHTSPQEFNRYKKYYKKLGNQVMVMDLIQEFYPVSTDEELNKERLSRLLFAISQLENQSKSSGNSKNSKLLHRYKRIVQRLVKMARLPK